jgi:hypothetical protein
MNSKILLFALLTLSCAGVPPGRPDGNNCGLIAAGNFDTRLPMEGLAAILADRLDAALDATTFTTDPSYLDMTENCQRLVGYRVWVRSAPDWEDDWGRGFRVAGTTSCWTKIIMVGTPASGNWRDSAIVHELFHAMQECEAIQPPDIGNDTAHAGWVRYGTFDAIERTR